MFIDLAGTSHHFGSDSGWLKKKHGPQPILARFITSVVITRTMYVWSKSRLRTRLNTVEILISLRWTVHPEQLHHGPGCRSEGLCSYSSLHSEFLPTHSPFSILNGSDPQSTGTIGGEAVTDVTDVTGLQGARANQRV